MTSTGLPPILRPRWSSASSKELRMSLPITAVGPEKVETKPILTVSPAKAGLASASAAAPASQNADFMIFPSLNSQRTELHAPLRCGRPLPQAYPHCFFARNSAPAASAKQGSQIEPSAQHICTIIRDPRRWQEL